MIALARADVSVFAVPLVVAGFVGLTLLILPVLELRSRFRLSRTREERTHGERADPTLAG